MPPALQRGTFGLEEGADEERMTGQLHGADLFFRVEAGEAQAGGLEAVAIGGIRTIVAVVAFMGALSVKDGVQLRSRGEPDVALLADQRAGEGSDDELGGGSRKLVT